MSAAQQLGIQDLLARHQDFITRVFDRGAAFAADIAASAIWFFAIPILAIFFLRDGRQTADAIIEAVEPLGDQTRVKRILRRVDTMLAKCMRAQLALAGFSFVFFSVSLLVLRIVWLECFSPRNSSDCKTNIKGRENS